MMTDVTLKTFIDINHAWICDYWTMVVIYAMMSDIRSMTFSGINDVWISDCVPHCGGHTHELCMKMWPCTGLYGGHPLPTLPWGVMSDRKAVNWTMAATWWVMYEEVTVYWTMAATWWVMYEEVTVYWTMAATWWVMYEEVTVYWTMVATWWVMYEEVTVYWTMAATWWVMYEEVTVYWTMAATWWVMYEEVTVYWTMAATWWVMYEEVTVYWTMVASHLLHSTMTTYSTQVLAICSGKDVHFFQERLTQCTIDVEEHLQKDTSGKEDGLLSSSHNCENEENAEHSPSSESKLQDMISVRPTFKCQSDFNGQSSVWAADCLDA